VAETSTYPCKPVNPLRLLAVQWYWQIDAIKTLTGIQKPLSGTVHINSTNIQNIDGDTLQKSKCGIN
jgi:hypothetical protein